MPFYRVKDKYIFLYLENYHKLRKIAFKDKPNPDLFSFTSRFKGRKEYKEAQMLMHKTINRIFRETPFERFYEEWIYFSFHNHNRLLYDLPYLFRDYGCINKLFSYERASDNELSFVSLDPVEDMEYSLEISLLEPKKLFGNQKKLFSTIIDTREIISIEGELNDFIIETERRTFHFGETIEII